ncbi:hypothetical protein [Leptospira andrefontaineae]|uniref:Uncharacterized protein n=1 Tax=Leptospira andrefontaineae TaxID=2484976 RepID=A0A4R9GZS7_9LEPT|nr:hypothetical protein [Leptospira andrefontaineae]TGK37241.1 hypothetical protein EHO65_16810 [Leptospira andrefontaineae]
MESINSKEIYNEIDSIDLSDDLVPQKIEEKVLKVLSNSIQRKSVLGMDIVGYSQYSTEKQVVVPILFRSVYWLTCRNIIESESFFFPEYKNEENFKENFIDTGDGGFQIFENPIQSLIFSIYLQLNIKRYNSQGRNKNLRLFLGKVNFRFSITYDDIYKIDENYYGTAIINCARILSKDSLDRFLIDEKTFDWFDYHLHGIENLKNLEKEDLPKIEFFSSYDSAKMTSLLANKDDKESAFVSSDVQRIGNIRSKNSIISIYNYHAQIMLFSRDHVLADKFSKFTCTLGNLNLSGITD